MTVGPALGASGQVPAPTFLGNGSKDIEDDTLPQVAVVPRHANFNGKSGRKRRRPAAREEPREADLPATLGLWRWLPLFLLVLSAIGFSFQALLVRQLTLRGFPIMQIITIRGLCQAIGCLVILTCMNDWPYAGLGGGSGKEARLLIARGVVGYAGITFGFLAVQNMPLAEAAIVQQTVPMFSAAYAWICLGERWHATEFISSLLGLFGVFLVSRPRWLFPDDDVEEEHVGVHRLAGVIFGTVGCASAGMAYVLIRCLGTRMKVHWSVVMLYQAIGQLLFSPLVMYIQETELEAIMELPKLASLLAIGYVGFLSQICMTKGMQMEKVAMSSLARQGLGPIFSFLWQVTFLPMDPVKWTTFGGFGTMLGSLILAVAGKARRENKAHTEMVAKATPNEDLQAVPARKGRRALRGSRRKTRRKYKRLQEDRLGRRSGAHDDDDEDDLDADIEAGGDPHAHHGHSSEGEQA